MVVEPEVIKFGVVEVVGFAATIASVTACVILWSVNYFQSKKQAEKFEKDVNARVARVENNVHDNATLMNKINVDVSYIRGRLEPK